MSGDGRGWHGEPERHSKAAKKASDGRVRTTLRIVREGVGSVVSGLWMVLTLPVAGIRVLSRQASGTWRNIGRAWSYLTFDNVLPPSLVGLGQWTIETLPKLFGVRGTTPWQQVGAAATFIGVALLATFLSGGLLIGAVVLAAGFGLIGVWRHIPWIDDRWQGFTALLPIKRDYDVPRWKRD